MPIRTFFCRSNTLGLAAICAAALLLNAVLAFGGVARAIDGFDPTYNENYFIDAFSSEGGAIAAREGGKMITLPGGDIVVAGRMRLNNDTLGNFWNIGLVRYSRSGERRVWAGSGAVFHAGGQYVVFPNLPNGGTGDNRITSVDDIAFAAGRIYVLVTRQFQASPTMDRDVAVYVFNENGAIITGFQPINSGSDEFGTALDVKVTNLLANPVSITVLADRSPGNMVVAKWRLSSAGTYNPDSSFGSGGITQINLPTSACPGFAACNLIPADIARPDRFGGGDSMPTYIAGSIQRGSTDWDFISVKLDSSGNLDTSFDGTGYRQAAFDQNGSSAGDYAVALIVESTGFSTGDVLYVAGDVSQSCKAGIGVTKTNGAGFDDMAFGAFGRNLFGGSDAVGTLCALAYHNFVYDITLQGNEIAAVGVAFRTEPIGGEATYNGALLRVDKGGGGERGLIQLPFLDNGSRVGASFLLGVVPAGSRGYSISGQGAGLGYESLYMTARVRADDTLFSDSFDY